MPELQMKKAHGNCQLKKCQKRTRAAAQGHEQLQIKREGNNDLDMRVEDGRGSASGGEVKGDGVSEEEWRGGSRMRGKAQCG